MRGKLALRDFDDREIELAVNELQQGGWLSDERFAEGYIRMRQNKGYGPVRISMELNERGVNEDIVNACLPVDNDSWLQILQQQYMKKYKNTPVTDYNDKVKRMRYLQYRGFPLDMIYQVVK
jgi:regulatory protein